MKGKDGDAMKERTARKGWRGEERKDNEERMASRGREGWRGEARRGRKV